MRSVGALIAAATLIASLSACSKADTPPKQAAPPAPIESMAPDKARAEIATSFPVETPVPEAVVQDGKAQGASAWDYSLVVNAPVSAVAEWYRSAYRSRSWSIVREQATSDGGLLLELRKGAAESRVTMTPVAEKTEVSAVLGIGVPVIESQ